MRNSIFIGRYLLQHFLYFLPLPHGQGSLRPGFFSAIFVLGEFNNSSRSLISSGLSGANSIEQTHPFFSNIASNSLARFFVFAITLAGLFSVPNFASFFPSNIFFIFSPFERYEVRLRHHNSENILC